MRLISNPLYILPNEWGKGGGILDDDKLCAGNKAGKLSFPNPNWAPLMFLYSRPNPPPALDFSSPNCFAEDIIGLNWDELPNV